METVPADSVGLQVIPQRTYGVINCVVISASCGFTFPTIGPATRVTSTTGTSPVCMRAARTSSRATPWVAYGV